MFCNPMGGKKSHINLHGKENEKKGKALSSMINSTIMKKLSGTKYGPKSSQKNALMYPSRVKAVVNLVVEQLPGFLSGIEKHHDMGGCLNGLGFHFLKGNSNQCRLFLESS